MTPSRRSRSAQRIEARNETSLSDTTRISPYIDLETPRHAAIGTDFGYDFGEGKAHSMTIGARLRHGPYAELDPERRPIAKRRSVIRPNAEYDWYHDGNLFYVGMSDYLAYFGYTWAWTSVHAGLISSPASGFVPFPYVYWSF